MEKAIRNYASCPISGEQVDQNVIRFVAGETLLLLVMYWITGASWVPFVLMVDFTIRGFFSRNYSPAAWIAHKVVHQVLHRIPNRIDAAPKRFAARLGVLFSVSLVLLELFQQGDSVLTGIVTAFFAIAAALESIFSYCVGCTIYGFFKQFSGVSRSEYYEQ